MEKERKPEVMVVDDMPDNLKLIVDILDQDKYKVRALPSGKLALESIKKKRPDLILLDISMPEMDGFEVCRCLKADGETKEIPVIFISALSDIRDKMNAFKEGGVDYITKPFYSDEVRARVDTHLKITYLQRTLQTRNRNLESEVEKKVHEISEAQLATIRAMTKLAEARDDDTGKHIERIRFFCRTIAGQLRYHTDFHIIDEEFINNLFQASPLHDIGKIAINDAILLKPDKLTPDEFEIMKTHADLGARTLEHVRTEYPNNAFISMGISIARSHHERWDGKGYPQGLKGDEIPVSARIMAIADVYDALRSKRVYKDAFPHTKTVRIIEEGSGSQFDPRVVDVFLSLEGEFERIREKLKDGDNGTA